MLKSWFRSLVRKPATSRRHVAVRAPGLAMPILFLALAPLLADEKGVVAVDARVRIALDAAGC